MTDPTRSTGPRGPWWSAILTIWMMVAFALMAVSAYDHATDGAWVRLALSFWFLALVGTAAWLYFMDWLRAIDRGRAIRKVTR